MNKVEEFYNQLNFPGFYTIEQLKKYGDPCENFYLRKIEQYVKNTKNVLDAGCGTGLTTNLLSLRNPEVQFEGLDFSNSINYARTFAIENNFNNVDFYKANLVNHQFTKNYDLIICQGVLHHIPEYEQVLHKFKSALNNKGILILGLYHPYGKILKKYFKINYKNEILHQDQENNPFELSFTVNQVKNFTKEMKMLYAGPTFCKSVILNAFFNFRSGGLTLYVLEKNK